MTAELGLTRMLGGRNVGVAGEIELGDSLGRGLPARAGR